MDLLPALQKCCLFRGGIVGCIEQQLVVLSSPALGCTLPARVFASLNGILLMFVGVVPD